MEYFGLAVLLTVVSSFLLVLDDSPKIIGPSLFSCMTTSVVPILMTSPFVVLLEAIAIYPLPD
jgi:ABC-type methionine transport system permease subunit